MMTGDNPMDDISDADLQAYHDGELDAARCLQVERWLSSHPEDARRMRSWQEIDQRLHQCYDGVLAESAAPPPLPAGEQGPSLLPTPSRTWGLTGLAQAAAVVGLMIGSGLLGWSLHPVGEALPQQRLSDAGQGGDRDAAAGAQVQTELIRPALFAHQVYALDQQRPVEVPAIQQASLNRWVSERMRTRLQAPDLSAQGLVLMGGRLLPSSNRMAAQFMYQDEQGQRTTVYVRRISDGGRSDFQYREQDQLHAFYWVDQAMGYAVVGKQPAQQLIGIAAAVQQAFATNSPNAQRS